MTGAEQAEFERLQQAEATERFQATIQRRHASLMDGVASLATRRQGHLDAAIAHEAQADAYHAAAAAL